MHLWFDDQNVTAEPPVPSEQRTHVDRHGLLDVFVTDQLHVSILIVMHLNTDTQLRPQHNLSLFLYLVNTDHSSTTHTA